MKRTYKEYSPLDSDYEFLDTEKEPSSLFKQILTTPTVNLPSQVENTVLPQALTQNVQSVHEAPRHTMPTRPKHSIRKPKQIISLLSETRSPLLKSQLEALLDPFWNHAMYKKYDAIIKSGTFELVPRPKKHYYYAFYVALQAQNNAYIIFTNTSCV